MRRLLLVALVALLFPAAAQATSNFVVNCPPSHVLMDDPIVFPGQPGASHEHHFFGNNTTNAFSTYASMLGQPTSCELSLDTAGYWVPTLRKISTGALVVPTEITVYYRNRPTNYGNPTDPFPADFRIIAGGAGKKGPGSNFSQGWTCSGQSDTAQGQWSQTIKNCSGSSFLKMHVMFPSCSNGALDSFDHRSHMKYRSGNTSCPASHPIKIPEVHIRVEFPDGIDASGGYRLADGAAVPHADFWNTWDQPKLEQLVTQCLAVDGVDCGPQAD